MLTALIALVLAGGEYVPNRPALEIESKTGIELPRSDMRPLSLRVTYPKAKGTYPLIVASHGMYGSEDGLLPLTEHWARSGYVVVQPTHDDSLRYAGAEERRAALSGSLDHTASWKQRPQDIRLVLDHVKDLERKVPVVEGKIDQGRIGVGGHSFGAWTTQVVAGMKLLGADALGLKLADPRPRAFVVISPTGIGGQVGKAAFADMRGPMLFVSGDNDFVRTAQETKLFRREAYDLCPAGGRYLVWIEDAYHDFGGINGRATRALSGLRQIGARKPEHVEIVKDATLAFWDSTLRDDPKAKKYLARKEIERRGGVKLSAR